MLAKPYLVRLTSSLLLFALLAWVLGGWSGRWSAPPATDKYQTAAVTRGDVVAKVATTGTLNPISVIAVGTQVSGRVSKVHVDFNDPVKAGRLLAEIDPAVYQAAVDQTQANLKSARASLALARQIETRHERLFAEGLMPRQSLDESVHRRIAAEADLAVLEAQLARDLANLSFTRIYAPVSGVVLTRQVAPGQTVAASFQTPTLFEIAEGLEKMQIECRISESDIGRLEVGQSVIFSVDAFPDQEFTGTLRQVRLAPESDDGIVTYTVVVDVDNSIRKLLPGMTALASVIVNRRKDVIRVPNVALSFRPRIDAAPASGQGNDHSSTKVYVPDGRDLRIVVVEVGPSDDEHTEITRGELVPGTLVAVGERTPGA